jgi:hypothetical protein
VLCCAVLCSAVSVQGLRRGLSADRPQLAPLIDPLRTGIVKVYAAPLRAQRCRFVRTALIQSDAHVSVCRLEDEPSPAPPQPPPPVPRPAVAPAGKRKATETIAIDD